MPTSRAEFVRRAMEILHDWRRSLSVDQDGWADYQSRDLLEAIDKLWDLARSNEGHVSMGLIVIHRDEFGASIYPDVVSSGWQGVETATTPAGFSFVQLRPPGEEKPLAAFRLIRGKVVVLTERGDRIAAYDLDRGGEAIDNVIYGPGATLP